MMEMQTIPTTEPRTGQKQKLKDIEAQVDPEENEEARKNKDMKRTLSTRIIQGSAIAAMVLNLIAMIIEWSGIMAAAGIVGIVVAGGVVYFQHELRNEDSTCPAFFCIRHSAHCIGMAGYTYWLCLSVM
jgi:hypothetical protein